MQRWPALQRKRECKSGLTEVFSRIRHCAVRQLAVHVGLCNSRNTWRSRAASAASGSRAGRNLAVDNIDNVLVLDAEVDAEGDGDGQQGQGGREQRPEHHGAG